MDNKPFGDSEQLKQAIIERARLKEFQDFDIDNPKTWCEKMQWLQIYDDKNPLKSVCADKIKVHHYCRSKLGSDICVPLLKIYDFPERLDFKELPSRFVLKCNHGYGYNIICRSKTTLNRMTCVSKLKEWLNIPFGLETIEPHYLNIPRKCFAEKFIENRGKADVTDYKFICFNGKPTFVQIINDRHKKTKRLNYYDMDFKFVDICRTDFPNNPAMLDSKPLCFHTMKEYAEILSADFRFVRVDFYEVNGRVYLGEMTFTPNTGFIKWTNPDIDRMFGDMLSL